MLATQNCRSFGCTSWFG